LFKFLLLIYAHALSEKVLIKLKSECKLHIISEKGIEMDSEKIKYIEGWSTPRNVFEVRSFIGIASYYKGFIEGFSNISHPITCLQKKGEKFEWTSDCERSFQHLKYLLTNAPILRIVDPNEDFIV
jgi:hypothetical protein